MASINLNVGFAGNSKSPGFKFKDIDLPLIKTSNQKQMRTLLDDRAIFNGIRNIIEWRKGWRVLQPEFGNGLHRFLYEPINDITARNIGAELHEMLTRWEPRITVTNISVSPLPDENTFYVSVEYTVPSFPDKNTYNFSTALSQEAV